MTKTQEQHEALSRAKNGDSDANYKAILIGFLAKGLPSANILPRENIFTYNAWKALKRQVNRGEKGVKVITWISAKSKSETDDQSRKFRKFTTVFHISQTSAI